VAFAVGIGGARGYLRPACKETPHICKEVPCPCRATTKDLSDFITVTPFRRVVAAWTDLERLYELPREPRTTLVALCD